MMIVNITILFHCMNYKMIYNLLSAPVTPPTDVKTKVVSATAIELQWGPVSAIGRNGKILGYKVWTVTII